METESPLPPDDLDSELLRAPPKATSEPSKNSCGATNPASEPIAAVTTIVLGGFALAFGIAFALGTRSIVRNVAAGFYARKLFEVGRRSESPVTEAF